MVSESIGFHLQGFWEAALVAILWIGKTLIFLVDTARDMSALQSILDVVPVCECSLENGNVGVDGDILSHSVILPIQVHGPCIM